MCELEQRHYAKEHPDIADRLNGLALLYDTQGKYAEAEPLYLRALAISEKVFGPEHPHVAPILNNLASIYRDQGQYREAGPLYVRSLAIFEKALGPEHPDVATSLNNLASDWRSFPKPEANSRRLSRFLNVRWRSGKELWAASTLTWLPV
jgi:tetratricopeptide (TPR) repeat protein